MKIKKSLIRNVAFVSTAACAVTVAHATESYQIGGVDLGTFSGTIDGGIATGGETFNNALAGGIQITETSGSVAPLNYVSVCTDLEGVLYLGDTYTYNKPSSFFTTPAPTGLSPTWGALNSAADLKNNSGVINTGNAAQAIQNAAYMFYNFGNDGKSLAAGNTTGISGTTSATLGSATDELEALQLAVWVALYNTDANGQIHLTGSDARFTFDDVDTFVTDDVDAYVTALNAQSLKGDFGYQGYLLQPSPTDQFGNTPQELLYDCTPPTSNGGPVVPEPSTIFAGALLVLPMAMSGVRILRKKQTA